MTTSKSSNTNENSTILTLIEPLALKLKITPAAYYTALIDTLFGGINAKRKECKLSELQVQTAQIVRLITRCQHYGINPLMGHVYAMEHNGVISYDLTINGWLYVLQNHKDFKNYSTVYSDNYIESKIIAGHNIPEWIRADIEFIDGRVFQGIRCYYLEEAENTTAWDKRPARILAGRSIAQATRFGLNISIDDTDDMPEYAINVDQKTDVKFDDEDEPSNTESNTAADEAEAQRLADKAAADKAEADKAAADEAEAQRLADKAAADKAEADKAAADEAEAQRLADKAAADKAAADEAAADEAEAQRLADKAAADEAAADEAEAQRLADKAAADKAAADEAEAQRLADEAEAQRLADKAAADKATADEAEAQRLADKAAADKAAADKAAADKAAADEAAADEAQWEEIDTPLTLTWEQQYMNFISLTKEKYGDVANMADERFRTWLEKENVFFNDFNENRLTKAKNFVNKSIEEELLKDTSNSNSDDDQNNVVDTIEFDFSLLSPEILTLIQNATHTVEDESSPDALLDLLDVLDAPLELAYIKKTLKDLSYDFDL